MKAYIFPGQGAQFSGMGLPLFESSPLAQELFNQANDILGWKAKTDCRALAEIMYNSDYDLLRK